MATNDFLPFATGGGANVVTQSAYAALGAVSTGYQAGVAASGQVNKTLRQSSIMAAVLAQLIVDVTGQPAVDDGTIATLLANLKSTVSLGVVGSMRNLVMSVTAASATATLTADEIVVETALGGLRYCLANFNKGINLAITGAGGMDTGTAPVSGYVALYAIYNPATQTSALLAKDTTSAIAPNVYGGANMPVGYTASALIGVWPTNASKQFVVGLQVDREYSFLLASAASTASQIASLTAVNIAAIVPQNAKDISGFMSVSGTATTNASVTIAGSPAGVGQVQSAGNSTSGTIQNVSGGSYSKLKMLTMQTFYWSAGVASGTFGGANVFISGYSI